MAKPYGHSTVSKTCTASTNRANLNMQCLASVAQPCEILSFNQRIKAWNYFEQLCVLVCGQLAISRAARIRLFVRFPISLKMTIFLSRSGSLLSLLSRALSIFMIFNYPISPNLPLVVLARGFLFLYKEYERACQLYGVQMVLKHIESSLAMQTPSALKYVRPSDLWFTIQHLHLMGSSILEP